MRIVSVSGFLALLTGAALAADIPSGAHLMLRMQNSVNTRTAQEGDYVYLRTASPVSVDGRIVLPVGTYVQGVVTHAERGGRIHGRAQLAVRLETFTLPGGQVLKLAPKLASVDSGGTGQKVDPEGDIEQGGTKAQDAGRIAIMAGSGAFLGAIVDRSVRGAGIGAGAGSVVGLATVLATRGRDVDLRQGTSLDVVFDRTVTIE